MNKISKESVQLTDADRRYSGNNLSKPDPATVAFTQGDIPFGTPFRLLCAISLFFLVLGPVAAAATLRHVRE